MTMSINIPSPNYFSTDTGFSSVSKANSGALGVDPWASAGLPADTFSQPALDPAMQAWVNQATYYHQMYQQLLSSGNLDPKNRDQVQAYDAQLEQWYQQVTGTGFDSAPTGWDPLAGMDGGP